MTENMTPIKIDVVYRYGQWQYKFMFENRSYDGYRNTHEGAKAAAELAINALVAEQLRELAELKKQGSYLYTPTGKVSTLAQRADKLPGIQRKHKQRESMKNFAIIFGSVLLLLLAATPIMVK